MARKSFLLFEKTYQSLLWRGMTSHFFTGGPLAYMNLIEGAEMLSSSAGKGMAAKNMGKSIRVLELTTGKKLALSLCHPNEKDPEKGYVSILSPLGAALLNASPGELLEVSVLGFSCKYKIL